MSADPIAERTAEIIALAQGQPRIRALSEAERETWARTQAENELARVPYLPGGLSWSSIEAAYRTLGTREPGPGYRRKRRAQPTRPETAAALLTSPATLRRACVAAGRGAQWPPRGL